MQLLRTVVTLGLILAGGMVLGILGTLDTLRIRGVNLTNHHNAVMAPNKVIPGNRPTQNSLEDSRKQYLQFRLMLSDEQAAKLAQILSDTQERLRELREMEVSERRVIQQNEDVSIHAILTSTQRTEYDTLIQQRGQSKDKIEKRQ